MKLVTATLFAALSLVSVTSEASTHTYVYSNVEYCQIAAQNAHETTLDAYSRKLGFTPDHAECKQLLKMTSSIIAGNNNTVDVEKQLKRMQRGSVIRLPKNLVEKLSDLPVEERTQALQKLFG